ncbi:hypothetical protein Taro_056332 [Colocasia esculenta]|uniref:Protein kinase domain-containing protein n=1 Tax=Colocasia esculenta TaxID=4460 RepID=A0A843XTM2_COLES|nr:hypothetical protein [Colocasia esculenta]
MEDGSRMCLLPSPPSLPSSSGGGGAATSEWIRGGCIGRGSFGSVSLAHDRSSGRVFAVKSVKLGSIASPARFPGSSAVEALENEIRILRSLSSPYVVSYIGEETTVEPGAEVHRNLLMEFVPGGTVAGLAARCREKGGAMEETTVRSYARCVTRALEYLHGTGVVHGDIKGRNVLASTTPGEAKVADFGSARRIHGGGGDWEDTCVGVGSEAAAGMDHPRGTPLWMAPEVVRGEPTSPASDVWSLGCTVIEMVTGRAPWSECAHQDAGHLLLRIALGEALPEFPVHELSKSGRDFLDKCLRRDPAERWSCVQLLRHPFLAEAAEQSPRSAFEWANFGFDSEEDEEEKSSLVASIVADVPSANSGIDLNGRVKNLVSNTETSWEDTEGWEVIRLAHPTTPPCLAGDQAGEARQDGKTAGMTSAEQVTARRSRQPYARVYLFRAVPAPIIAGAAAGAGLAGAGGREVVAGVGRRAC